MSQLKMLLIDSPQIVCPPPAGWYIRTHDPENGGLNADCGGWAVACERLCGGIKSPEDVKRMMLDDPNCGPNHIFYICRRSDGRIAATATANFNPSLPTLHMVGAANEFTGLGLSRSVCAAAVNCLIGAGFRHIGLSTDDFRVPAVKTYLRLGFRPWYYEDDMKDRWRALIDSFGYDRGDYFAYGPRFGVRVGI